MELTEVKYENDTLKHKWADYMERQRWLPSRELPEVCPLSTLRREAQTRLRQHLTLELSRVRQIQENCVKLQEELRNRHQSLQATLAEVSGQLEEALSERQRLYTRKYRAI